MTPGGGSSRHFDQATLSRYFDGDLGEEIEEALECHLADCEECAASARSLYNLAETFASWTAAAHGATWQAEIVQEALSRAAHQVNHPLWQRRLERWREAWSGKAEAALRWALEWAGEAVQPQGQSVDSLVRAGSPWSLAPAPQFGGTWGADDSEGSALFASAALSPATPRLFVELVGGAQRQVVVRVDGLPAADDPPLVLLISLRDESSSDVRVAEVEPLPQAGSFLTRFRQLAAGEYLVVVEPRESSTQGT